MERKNDHQKITLELPPNSFQEIEKRNREVVDAIIKNLENQYSPSEAITGIKIVAY